MRLTLLRSDIVNLLHHTYEYWFFTFANFLSVTLLGLYLGDPRGGLMPGVDADVVTARHYMNATAAMLIFALVLVTFVFYELIDEANQFVIFWANDRALSVEVALVNTWATVMIVLGRNLYRRRAPDVLIFTFTQLAMMSVLVFGVEYDIRDRVMYRAVVHRRRIAAKVAPFLLSRIFTLLGWSGRMLWRIWMQQSDELILLHGSVFYDSKLSQVRQRKVTSRKRSAFTRTAVLPMPRTLTAGGPPDLTE